jgi:L-alanine-DL-glutamate epimerase-like enolase superfamily enzyme
MVFLGFILTSLPLRDRREHRPSIFWGDTQFAQIRRRRWADAIMPDVKHVGGLGPLLDVIKASTGSIEVSPHNPAGPISTAPVCTPPRSTPTSSARSNTRRPEQTRRRIGERIEAGVLLLNDKPVWGVEPPA